MNAQLKTQPVIIVGAARSGTNMLRDMLVQVPYMASWPCDEINYIWRHGNVHAPHDELSPSDARPAVTRYIRNAFRKMAERTRSRYLVEKTCANSLRVGFVKEVVPEAKYVFIVRDGRDVVASAMKRWKAPLDPVYVMKKARFVPPGDFLYYAARYFTHRAYKMFSAERRLASWGPRFAEMQHMLAHNTLEEVCAAQWARSVEAVSCADSIPAKQVIRLQYEQIVSQPEQEFARLLRFLGTSVSHDRLQAIVSGVSAGSVGKWQHDLSPEVVARITPWLEPQLSQLGYETEGSAHQRAA